jgi:DNA helicase TIP49 (TBP-interacting protein)
MLQVTTEVRSHKAVRTLLQRVKACCLAARQVEGISIDEEGLAYLGEMSESTSLRHAVQLLTPAATLAATNGRDDVTKVDLEEVRNRLIPIY